MIHYDFFAQIILLYAYAYIHINEENTITIIELNKLCKTKFINYFQCLNDIIKNCNYYTLYFCV